MDNYLIIAYKPSFDDYCRGCLMASYSSDLEIEVFEAEYFEEYLKGHDTRDHALEIFVRYLVRNEFMDGSEIGYELTVFKNGVEDVTFEFESETKEVVQQKVSEKQQEQRERDLEAYRKQQAENEAIERQKLVELKLKYEAPCSSTDRSVSS